MNVRAILIRDKKILLIHRIKNNREFYVVPGGHVENNETPEEAIVREVKEETNLDSSIQERFYEFVNEFDNDTHIYYVMNVPQGDVKIIGPEAHRKSTQNSYTLEWHSIESLRTLNFVPEFMKEKIILLSQKHDTF